MRKRSTILASTAVTAALLAASTAFAAPTYTPFLSVDFNGSGGGPANSPTFTGFTGFSVDNPAATTSLSQTIGANTVTIATNPSATGSTLTSRDRGAVNSSASDLLRDFALVIRDGAQGLGYSYLTISISGLTPNAAYEFTGFAEDSFSAGAGTNREGFSTVVPTSTLTGGAASYQPAPSYANAPTGAGFYYTSPMLAPAGEYDEAVSFNANADATGKLTIYAWGDATDYGNQTATIVNGFQLGAVAAVPEPASLGLLAVGGFSLLARRRRG